MEHIPWVEKYRPAHFDDIVLEENNRIILNNNKKIPNNSTKYLANSSVNVVLI